MHVLLCSPLAPAADGRRLDLELQAPLFHLTLACDGGDGERNIRIAIPFVVVPGCNNVVTLGDNTIRECLGLDIGRIVKEKLMRLGDTNTVKVGSTSVCENAEEQAWEQGKCWTPGKCGHIERKCGNSQAAEQRFAMMLVGRG